MATPALITVLFWKEWSVYALIVATIIGPGVLAKIYRKAENQKQRKELGLIVTLTFFSMLFWAFAQQGGSSISLYIDRFVNRDMFGYTVPTAMFQSINAFAVMLCGVFWRGWLKKASRVIVPCASGEICSWPWPDERRILHSDLKRPLVRNVWSLFSATDGIRHGGDGLCGTVYRPGCHVANYAH